MTEREKFEAWAVSPESWCQGIERHGDSYKAVATAASWVAYQTGIRSAAPSQPEGAEGEPLMMRKEVEAALTFALWHHQGGSSKVGQPIRKMLGMGEHARLTDGQVEQAKRVQAAFAAAGAAAPDEGSKA